MIIIGDVHGCYKTLLALLDKLPEDDICFVGDLIDRGPQSREVIELVTNNYQCVMGNHEDMMINVGLIYEENLWLYNGGQITLDSYPNREPASDHIEWMRQLPLYLKLDDLGLIVSHSSAANFFNNNKPQHDILWGRDKVDYPPKIDGYFNVFGHTPRKEPLVKEHFANIDTGCTFGYNLTALQFPEMKIYTQKCLDR